MFKVSAKLLSTFFLICGLIGIQAQLSSNNVVFASSYGYCCDNNLCNGMDCSDHSTKLAGGGEITITCQQCMDYEIAGSTYCTLPDGRQYYGDGCSSQFPMTGAISGPSIISTPSGKYDPANSYTWTVSVTNGATPYTYIWHKVQDGNEIQVGTGSTYTERYSWTPATGSTTFSLHVHIQDAGACQSYSGQAITTDPLEVQLYYGIEA